MNNIKRFVLKGACFAWMGPVILAVIWAILKANGKIGTLSVDETVLGIISSTVMAFIAAGISFVYGIESLPKSFAALIQGAVLYIDYLAVYLLNGWLPSDRIWQFTGIFAVAFIVIWLCIYIPTRHKVDRMNKNFDQ